MGRDGVIVDAAPASRDRLPSPRDEHLTRLLLVGAASAATAPLGIELLGYLIPVVFVAEFVS